jgi:hypothetical protein
MAFTTLAAEEAVEKMHQFGLKLVTLPPPQ